MVTKKKRQKRHAAARPATKRGRPAGAKSREYDSATVVPSRCQRCGSTKRTPYTKRHILTCGGQRSPTTGLAYNLVVLRWTSCEECDQHRVDRSEELVRELPADPADVEAIADGLGLVADGLAT